MASSMYKLIRLLLFQVSMISFSGSRVIMGSYWKSQWAHSVVQQSGGASRQAASVQSTDFSRAVPRKTDSRIYNALPD
jgi:hypothetical protein